MTFRLMGNTIYFAGNYVGTLDPQADYGPREDARAAMLGWTDEEDPRIAELEKERERLETKLDALQAELYQMQRKWDEPRD
jgi:hypothetical protein